ncbi:hypothetical protein E6R18_14215 [Streptomyces sp. A1277]|nr:hypothetical protein E6R18_14215 [Streptomyces sp. A1277]
MDSEEWEGPDLATGQSPLAYPPCQCGSAGCPDQPSQDAEGRAADRQVTTDSPVFTGLRARVRDENARRKFGRLG